MLVLFSVSLVSVGLVMLLIFTEPLWFAVDKRPMLEQIEEARMIAAHERLLAEDPVIFTIRV